MVLVSVEFDCDVEWAGERAYQRDLQGADGRCSLYSEIWSLEFLNPLRLADAWRNRWSVKDSEDGGFGQKLHESNMRRLLHKHIDCVLLLLLPPTAQSSCWYRTLCPISYLKIRIPPKRLTMLAYCHVPHLYTYPDLKLLLALHDEHPDHINDYVHTQYPAAHTHHHTPSAAPAADNNHPSSPPAAHDPPQYPHNRPPSH